MSLLVRCRNLLARRGAVVLGTGPQALRGHLDADTPLLVIVKGRGERLSVAEQKAIDTVRRQGGVAFAARSEKEIEAELEVREA